MRPTISMMYVHYDISYLQDVHVGRVPVVRVPVVRVLDMCLCSSMFLSCFVFGFYYYLVFTHITCLIAHMFFSFYFFILLSTQKLDADFELPEEVQPASRPLMAFSPAYVIYFFSFLRTCACPCDGSRLLM